MKAEEFDWGAGKVVYWDMNVLRENVAIRAQLDELKEDLAQVRFGDENLLDVGWYPEFSENGTFVVTVVRHEDWEAPIYRQEAPSWVALRDAIGMAVKVAGRGEHSHCGGAVVPAPEGKHVL